MRKIKHYDPEIVAKEFGFNSAEEMHAFSRKAAAEDAANRTVPGKLKYWCVPHWRGDTLPERIKGLLLNGPGAFVSVAAIVLGYYCAVEGLVFFLRQLLTKL